MLPRQPQERTTNRSGPPQVEKPPTYNLLFYSSGIPGNNIVNYALFFLKKGRVSGQGEIQLWCREGFALHKVFKKATPPLGLYGVMQHEEA